MKNSKFPYIALSLVVFFVGLFIVWMNRFDHSEDFREFRSALGFSFNADETPEADSTGEGTSYTSLSMAGDDTQLIMSEEEATFYEQLANDFPSLEAIEKSCLESIRGHNWSDVAVDGASFNEDRADHLAQMLNESFVNMFEGPSPVFTHTVDFLINHDSVDPQRIYQLLNETSRLCLDREFIQRLRGYIEQSHSLGWDEVAKYKISVIYEPMLFIFQTIHTPERMLLYINTLEAMEQYGIVNFTTDTNLQSVRTRLEDLHTSIVADLNNPGLNAHEKSQALRRYINDTQIVSMELTEVAIEGTRRIMPR